MNIKVAKENFQKVKDSILKDGKVTPEEVNILLNFLEPYARTYSKRFCTLQDMLEEAKTLGYVKDQEKMKDSLERAYDFLRLEYRIERGFCYTIAFLLLSTLFALVVG